MVRTFCRRCFKYFDAKIVRGKRQQFCSPKCKREYKRIRCKEPCKEFFRIHVTFANGTRHIKRICRHCRRGNFIPLDS